MSDISTNKEKFLQELNERMIELFDELGDKHGIDIEEQLYFAYAVALWNGEDENVYTANSMCADKDELHYLFSVMDDDYTQNEQDEILGTIFLN